MNGAPLEPGQVAALYMAGRSRARGFILGGKRGGGEGGGGSHRDLKVGFDTRKWKRFRLNLKKNYNRTLKG